MEDIFHAPHLLFIWFLSQALFECQGETVELREVENQTLGTIFPPILSLSLFLFLSLSHLFPTSWYSYTLSFDVLPLLEFTPAFPAIVVWGVNKS